MRACFVVFTDPCIEIGLQLVDRMIHLLAERDTVELVQHGLVEALADAVGLRALGLGAGVVPRPRDKARIRAARDSVQCATSIMVVISSVRLKLE